MLITAANLNEVVFENEDARLLILDVVSHTTARLYYYHNSEITACQALKIWHRASAADGCSISFLNRSGLSEEHESPAGCARYAML